MNSEDLILFRLLEGFPVKALRDYFGVVGLKQDDIIDGVLQTNTPDQVKEWVFENFGRTHQHIYIFDSNRDLPNTWTPAPQYFHSSDEINGIKTYNLLFRISYTLFNTATRTEEKLLFDSPVQIKLYKGKIIISINTLERLIGNYFANRVHSFGKNFDDDAIISVIRDSLPAGISFTNCDINKGIKKLWKDDFIDAGYTRFKKSKSTATEAMDEDNTLKLIYPDLYKEIIKTPIDRQVFYIVDKSVNLDEYVSKFAIEPTRGRVIITQYPQLKTSVLNVLDEIITNN